MAATPQALTTAIAHAEQAIADLIAGDEPPALLYAQLTSVPGVGAGYGNTADHQRVL